MKTKQTTFTVEMKAIRAEKVYNRVRNEDLENRVEYKMELKTVKKGDN